MPRLELPDRFCSGVETPDGRQQFRADRPGSTIVNEALARHFEAEGLYVSRGNRAGFSTAQAPTIECPHCGWERWSWVPDCRCAVSGVDPKAAA